MDAEADRCSPRSDRAFALPEAALTARSSRQRPVRRRRSTSMFTRPRLPALLRRFGEGYASLRLLADRRLALLAAANVLDRMSVALVVPLLPLYATRLGAGPATVGLLFAVETAAQAICSAPAGRVADRVGRRPAIVAGTTVSGGALAALALVGSPAALVALRALDGVGSALRGPATTAYVGDAVPTERRGRALGAYQTLGRLGVVLGPALGGLLAVDDPGLPFLVLGVPTALAGVGLLALPAVSGGDEDDEAADTGWWTLRLRDLPPVVALLAIASLLAGVSSGAFGPLFALHLEAALGVGPAYLGAAWSVFGAALLVGTPLGGTLADATDRVRGVVAGQLGWVAAYTALATALTPLVPVFALALGGLASAVAGPAKGALNYETAPESVRGTVLGLYGALWAAGAALGPVLGGAVAARAGAAAALYCLAALALCHALLVGVGVRSLGPPG